MNKIAKIFSGYKITQNNILCWLQKVFDLLTLFEPFTTPLCPQQTAKGFADTLVPTFRYLYK